MDEKNSVIVCPQCQSKEVIKGKMIRGEQEYGCLTCGFRSRSFHSVSKKDAKELPEKPRNFSEDTFKMAEIIKKDNKAGINIIKLAEFLLIGIFIVFVLIVLFLVFLYPNL